MDAQTVLDNINKYRYGVLIGNCTEERFGQDIAQQQKNLQIPQSNTKDSFGIKNSVINQQTNQVSNEEKEFKDNVKFNYQGVQNHLLLGHGVKQNDFEKRHIGSSYDLSYNQQIQTNKQINSKFDANLKDQPKKFDCRNVYDKDYQKNIPVIGEKLQNNTQNARPYDEYTKTFDSTHYKIPLRK